MRGFLPQRVGRNRFIAPSTTAGSGLSAGRTVEQKKAFYQAVVDGLHERIGLRREDVFINLVEVAKENWSFGNGVAQYVS